MPRLKKLLSKLSRAEARTAEILIEKIISLNWRNLDMKRLKGHHNIFRVRKGSIRVIFLEDRSGISILSVERRREDTYKF